MFNKERLAVRLPWLTAATPPSLAMAHCLEAKGRKAKPELVKAAAQDAPRRKMTVRRDMEDAIVKLDD
jgi:hypothetical protein